jgi:selenocysteine lyase/cysteine desulfurase
VCVSMPDAMAAFHALRAAGVSTTVREGAVRLSPHLYNTAEEMARVAELLDGALGNSERTSGS